MLFGSKERSRRSPGKFHASLNTLKNLRYQSLPVNITQTDNVYKIRFTSARGFEPISFRFGFNFFTGAERKYERATITSKITYRSCALDRRYRCAQSQTLRVASRNQTKLLGAHVSAVIPFPRCALSSRKERTRNLLICNSG